MYFRVKVCSEKVFFGWLDYFCSIVLSFGDYNLRGEGVIGVCLRNVIKIFKEILNNK